MKEKMFGLFLSRGISLVGEIAIKKQQDKREVNNA